MLEDPSETCCGGVDCFPRPFESFAEIYTKFHEISTENECSGHWDSGNRVRTSSEGLRRQNSVFLSSDFCFSPKSKFLNDFENGKSIETRKYFLEWRKTHNKKLFWLFARFFFSIANNSKTRGDRANLSCLQLLGTLLSFKIHHKKFQKNRDWNKKVMLHLSLESGASASQDASFIPLTHISISMVILVN